MIITDLITLLTPVLLESFTSDRLRHCDNLKNITCNILYIDLEDKNQLSIQAIDKNTKLYHKYGSYLLNNNKV